MKNISSRKAKGKFTLKVKFNHEDLASFNTSLSPNSLSTTEVDVRWWRTLSAFSQGLNRISLFENLGWSYWKCISGFWLTTADPYRKACISTCSTLTCSIGMWETSFLVMSRRTHSWECHPEYSCFKRCIRFCSWLSTTPACSRECKYRKAVLRTVWGFVLMSREFQRPEGFSDTPVQSPGTLA